MGCGKGVYLTCIDTYTEVMLTKLLLPVVC